ncbi:MAG: DUF3108 domain-containing protein [Chromatiales bacterium]
MSRLRPASAILALLAGLTPAAQDQLPAPLAPVSAEYRVLRDGIPLAHVEVRLEVHTDGTYRYESHTAPAGLIAWLRDDEILERSQGTWHAGGFVPRRYSYSHQTGDGVRDVEIEFDWAGQRAVNRAGGTTWTMSVPQSTQDKLGQQLTLMIAMGRGLRTIDIQVADGGVLKTYRYQVQGREVVRSPAGEFLAWRVRRRKDDRPSRLTLWSAPALGYLPVRMDRREGDDTYRLELVSVTHGPGPGGPVDPQSAPALSNP